jgi:hypothetical protein
MASEAQQNRSIFERHVQSGLQGLIVVMIIWFGSAVVDAQKSLARMEERFIGLDARMAGLERQITATADDRYSGSAARRDQDAITNRLNDHEGRLRALESGRRMGGP